MTEEKKNIRVIIVDDHQLFRIGIKGILTEDTGIEVVGEAASSQELFTLLPDIDTDIVLLDIILPELSGIVIAERLRKDYPEIKILVLSSESDRRTLSELVTIGIDGFIGKDLPREELIKAVTDVANGSEYYGRDIARIIHCIRVSKRDVSDDVFTLREKEIIQLSIKGLQAKEIADKLNINVGTVNVHKNNIFRKLGINNSVELVNYCLKNGIIHI
ncbi:MAG: response regulator transcription factor [Bacteroidales bacterium]|nr:response regulator transcription factor [Bacteroidales bacterium]